MSKFNFNIDIEDNEKQDSLSKFKYNSKSLMQLYLDLYVVDLGLPSKTIWCRYNLGVDINLLNNIKDWYGDYYAWGEIESKSYYYWECKNDPSLNYKYAINYNDTLTKYCDNYSYGNLCFTDHLTQLLPEDDAAYLNMHVGNYKFVIPSEEQVNDLINHTTSEWVKNYNNIKGLNGKIFKSKINDDEMFIPAAGYYSGSSLYGASSLANIWISNIDIETPDHALDFYFSDNVNDINSYSRYYGFSIRPVLLQN